MITVGKTVPQKQNYLKEKVALFKFCIKNKNKKSPEENLVQVTQNFARLFLRRKISSFKVNKAEFASYADDNTPYVEGYNIDEAVINPTTVCVSFRPPC